MRTTQKNKKEKKQNTRKQTAWQVLTILGIVMLPFAANAAPSITSVSGTVADKGSVTISGSGFGTKAQAQPSLFDKTEGTWSGLSNGQALPQSSSTATWKGLNDSHYDTTSGDQRSVRSIANYNSMNSIKNMVQDFTLPGRPGKVYMSWWFKSSLSDTGGKFIRFSDSNIYGGDIGNKQFVWANAGNYIWDAQDGGYCYFSNSVYSNNSLTNWADSKPSASTWHLYEVYIDNVGKTWQTFIDNVDHSNGLTKWTGCANILMDNVSVLGLDAGGTNPPAQNSWLDDIYLDTSWAHVVIGNASTYAGSTHFEMQPSTAWGSGSITATVNQGSFANGAAGYLYVVDSNGAASNALPVTFGSGGTAPAPAPPTATIPAK